MLFLRQTPHRKLLTETHFVTMLPSAKNTVIILGDINCRPLGHKCVCDISRILIWFERRTRVNHLGCWCRKGHLHAADCCSSEITGPLMFRVRIRHNLPRKHAQKECGWSEKYERRTRNDAKWIFQSECKMRERANHEVEGERICIRILLASAMKNCSSLKSSCFATLNQSANREGSVQGYKSWSHMRKFLFFFPLLAVSLWSLTRQTHKLINILESTLHHNIPRGRKTATVHSGCATAQLGAL